MDVAGLRALVEDLQAANPSVGACRRLASTVAKQLEGEPTADVEVRQGYFRGEDGTAEHFYVRCHLESGETVVVDAAVQQFTYENWVEGRADTYVSEEEFPGVGVITSEMAIYDRYG